MTYSLWQGLWEVDRLCEVCWDHLSNLCGGGGSFTKLWQLQSSEQKHQQTYCIYIYKST